VIVNDIAELPTLVGQELGKSEWLTVDQPMINAFAVATRDEQWIHVSPERAKAGPFGTTVAHGFLSLSLCGAWVQEILEVPGAAMTVNYGLDKARFPAPLPVDSRVRATAAMESAELREGFAHTVIRMTVEVEGQAKPCCVADVVIRYYE
jgi:acyl dehydratase